VHVDAGALRDAQMALARQLGALHEYVPAGKSERDSFKDVTRAALAPDAGDDARCRAVPAVLYTVPISRSICTNAHAHVLHTWDNVYNAVGNRKILSCPCACTNVTLFEWACGFMLQCASLALRYLFHASIMMSK
jgi:hypothetical protein